MKVSVLVMTDDGQLFAMAKDTFDDAKGYTWEQLHKLYLDCRRELAIKTKKAEDIKAEEAK